MLTAEEGDRLRDRHREFERRRSQVWLEHVRAGLAYRRAMRAIDEKVAAARLDRDAEVRRSVRDGASYREVARALGLSHSRIQQIVNEGPRAGTKASAAR